MNETTPGPERRPESSSCANGLSGPALEYETDGVTLANREFGGVHEGSIQMVDPDAVQEVRVETEASGAQFAAPATAIINTKEEGLILPVVHVRNHDRTTHRCAEVVSQNESTPTVAMRGGRFQWTDQQCGYSAAALRSSDHGLVGQLQRRRRQHLLPHAVR